MPDPPSHAESHTFHLQHILPRIATTQTGSLPFAVVATA